MSYPSGIAAEGGPETRRYGLDCGVRMAKDTSVAVQVSLKPTLRTTA